MDGRVLLIWILKDKTGVRAVDSPGSVKGPVASCYAHGDGPFWRYQFAGMSWLVMKLSPSRETLLRHAAD
jgi:hypothetical protein